MQCGGNGLATGNIGWCFTDIGILNAAIQHPLVSQGVVHCTLEEV
jgi:hypothetical protein